MKKILAFILFAGLFIASTIPIQSHAEPSDDIESSILLPSDGFSCDHAYVLTLTPNFAVESESGAELSGFAYTVGAATEVEFAERHWYHNLDILLCSLGNDYNKNLPETNYGSMYKQLSGIKTGGHYRQLKFSGAAL